MENVPWAGQDVEPAPPRNAGGMGFVFDARTNLVLLRSSHGETVDEMPLEIYRRTFGSEAVRLLLKGA